LEAITGGYARSGADSFQASLKRRIKEKQQKLKIREKSWMSSIGHDLSETVCDSIENNRQQMTRLFSVRRRQPLYNSSASRIGMSAAAAAAAAGAGRRQ